MEANKETQLENGPTVGKFLQFRRLPLEIRELIWEASLPEQRVLHIHTISRVDRLTGRARERTSVYSESDPFSDFFKFHRPPKSPVSLQVCVESRALALRVGFFFLRNPNSRDPLVWCNPAVDMLYFDSHNRTSLIRLESRNAKSMAMPDLDRIQHVGVEWISIVDDMPVTPTGGVPVVGFWNSQMTLVMQQMPNIKTFDFFLPIMRYKGEWWRGGPHGAVAYKAVPEDLPREVEIPWMARGKLLKAGDEQLEEDIEQPAEVQHLLDSINTAHRHKLGEKDRDTAGSRDVKKRIEAILEENPSRAYPIIQAWWLVQPGLLDSLRADP